MTLAFLYAWEDAKKQIAELERLLGESETELAAVRFENETLRARITELEEQAEFQRRLRAGA